MAVQRSAPLQKVPIRIWNMPIQPTKYAHPTYEKCTSDIQKAPIRPTKNAHPTYEKCPSNLPKSAHPTYEKVPIRPTKNAHLTYEKYPSELSGHLQLQLFISTLLRYRHDKSCWI